MTIISHTDLIKKAESVVKPRRIHDYLVGNVGAALITDQGHIYLGVCMDVMSGIGFCAEHSAIAAMVTAGEHRIQKIVAVWKGEDGLSPTHILSPCGRCREFIRQIHPDNIQTEVILDIDKVLKLSDLLPYPGWFQKI